MSRPRSRPAAPTESGTVEVSVSPGADVDLEEPHVAGVVDDEVGAGEVAQPQRLVRVEATWAHAAATSSSSLAGTMNSVDPAV